VIWRRCRDPHEIFQLWDIRASRLVHQIAKLTVGNTHAERAAAPDVYSQPGICRGKERTMVIARIRTNARKITVRVRNGPVRTITAPTARPAATQARRVVRPAKFTKG